MSFLPTHNIKAEALRLGFSACGVATACAVPDDVYQQVEDWVAQGYHGEMSYLERNHELRRDPRLLVEGTRSIIMVALGYFPAYEQSKELPQIARYAYGRDYHKVVKKLLDQLLDYMRREVDPELSGRSFADSAPLLERYWAEQAGIGARGKHGLMIVPRLGSYHVLGALLVSTPLECDTPIRDLCGRCTRCLDSCPTGALVAPRLMDARRCISYLTIEQKGEIPPELAERMGNRLYGCDICQEVCPHNRLARPTAVADFAPREQILTLRPEDIEGMTTERFDQISAGSPIRRTGLLGLQRSLRAIRPNLIPSSDKQANEEQS